MKFLIDTQARWKIIAIILVAIVIVSGIGVYFYLAGTQPTTQIKTKLKVGVIMPGTTADPTWNMLGYRTLTDLAREVDWLEVSFTENQWNVADAERSGREYASSGYDIVYFHGGQYVDATLNTAKDYPQTYFICGPWAPVSNLSSNVGQHSASFYQVGFIAGVLSGLTTKSNVVGAVIGIKTPIVVEFANALAVGLKWVNPNATYLTSLIGQMNDPSLAKTAALTQISTGADVIYCGVNLGTIGVNEAAVEKNVSKIIYLYIWPPQNPSLYLTAEMFDLRKVMLELFESVRAGHGLGITAGGGLTDGATYLAPYPNVPKEVAAIVDKLTQDIKNGTLVVPKVPLLDIINNASAYADQLPAYNNYVK